MNESELFNAAGDGDVAAVVALLATGAQVNEARSNGETALMRAASKGRLDVVRLLMKAGADVNAPRADGLTPLIYAAFFGHADVVRLLIDHGADLEARDRLGMSALDWAKAKGATDTANVLQGGAEPEGRQPATHRDAGQEVISEAILVQRGAIPPAAEPSGSAQTGVDGRGRLEHFARPASATVANSDETGPPSSDSGLGVEDGAKYDRPPETYTQIQTMTWFHYACIILSLMIIFATLTWVIFQA